MSITDGAAVAGEDGSDFGTNEQRGRAGGDLIPREWLDSGGEPEDGGEAVRTEEEGGEYSNREISNT